MMKKENDTLQQKICVLKNEVSGIEVLNKKIESQKADLEYKMRSQEYNVEILKNQLENHSTENILLQKQT